MREADGLRAAGAAKMAAGSGVRAIIAFLLSLGLGSLAGWLVYLAFADSGFDKAANVIGYPMHADYNNRALLYGYLLGLAFSIAAYVPLRRIRLPVSTSGMFGRLPLRRIWPPVSGNRVPEYLRMLTHSRASLRLPTFGDNFPRVVVALLIGLAYAPGLAMAVDVPDAVLWVACSLILLFVWQLGHGADAYLKRNHSGSAAGESTFEFWLLAASILLIPLSVWSVSEHTRWIGQPSGVSVRLRWFPLSALGLFEVVVLLLIRSARRSADPIGTLAQSSLGLVVLPTLVFLLMASAPGTYNLFDDFHKGESLAPLVLGLSGDLPWRDFLFVHGVSDDFLKPYVSALLFERSLRGGMVGQSLLYTPLYWAVSFVVFFAILGKRLLPATAALSVALSLGQDPFRFVLYPLVLYAAFALFARRKPFPVLIFALLSAAQIVLAPEFALVAIGLGLTIAISEIAWSPPHANPLQKLRLSLTALGGALLFLVATAGFLAVAGLLDGFLITFTHFSRGHWDTGGIRVERFSDIWWMCAVPLVFSTGAIFTSLEHPRGKAAPAVVWLTLGMAISTALYFSKFIGRPDKGHILQVVAVAAPGIALLVVHWIDRISSRSWFGAPSWLPQGISMSCAILFFSIIGMPGFASMSWSGLILESVKGSKERFAADSPEVGAGIVVPGIAFDALAKRAQAVEAYLASRLMPGDTVFDLSDSPMLVHAVLRLRPASRFIFASMAIRPETQRLVIRDLERTRPAYVIYQAEGGLNGWDEISSQVRHHLLVDYVNRHYRFEANVAGVLLFRNAPTMGTTARNSPDPEPGLPDALASCDLGFVPSYYKSDEALRFQAVANGQTAKPTKVLRIAGWAALLDGERAEIRIVSRAGELDRLVLADPRRSKDDTETRTHRRTTFSRFLAPVAPVDDLEVELIESDSGRAHRLADAGTLGHLDTQEWYEAIILDPAGQGGAPHYLALELEDRPDREAQEFFLLAPGVPQLAISFRQRPGTSSLLLPIGGCYAWSTIYRHGPILASNKAFSLEKASYGR